MSNFKAFNDQYKKIGTAEKDKEFMQKRTNELNLIQNMRPAGIVPGGPKELPTELMYGISKQQ